MRKSLLYIGIILSMFLVSVGSAQPEPPSSYWGHVSVDDVLTSGASVTVHDASGKEIVNDISVGSPNLGLYQVTVPWDDSTTSADEGVVAGETIVIKVKGIVATSRVIDPRGSNTEIDLSVNTSSSSSSSSNGGSSDVISGGNSPAVTDVADSSSDAPVVKSDSATVSTIGEGSAETASFEHTEITDIEIKVVNAVQNIKIEVKTLESKPDTVTVVEKEIKASSSKKSSVVKTFKYMSIDVDNLDDGNVDGAKIDFKVDKSWINENDIEKSSVKLVRFHDGWSSLPTEILNEDAEYVYYAAETPGFSVFAIVGEEIAEPVPAKTETPVVVDEADESVPTSDSEEDGESNGIPGFEGIAAIALIGAVHYLQRK